MYPRFSKAELDYIGRRCNSHGCRVAYPQLYFAYREWELREIAESVTLGMLNAGEVQSRLYHERMNLWRTRYFA